MDRDLLKARNMFERWCNRLKQFRAITTRFDDLATHYKAEDVNRVAGMLPAVAARAGVHPTTLYRRWGSIARLLTDVAPSRFSDDLVVPDSGSLAGDLQRWLADVVTDVADPDTLALMRATIATGPAGGCACVEDRHRQLAAILQREADRAGTAPDAQSAADLLLGPLYYRAVFTPEPAFADWARSLVETYLSTLRAT